MLSDRRVHRLALGWQRGKELFNCHLRKRPRAGVAACGERKRTIDEKEVGFGRVVEAARGEAQLGIHRGSPVEPSVTAAGGAGDAGSAA